MTKEHKVLSEVITYMKYAKYLPDLQRRETWEELIQRNMDMHIKKYPGLKDEIVKVYSEYVITKKVLPSMRSLQFAGKAAEVNPARLYNCSYTPLDDIRAFSETIFLSLSGVGVGIDVQKHHIEKLPTIHPPTDRKRKFVITDDIAGWADAIKILLKSYTKENSSSIVFDYSQIREKGALLVTSGGKAPGPAPLRIALERIRGVMDTIPVGGKISSFQAHRMACFIADSVLTGGIRRSSLISLFSPDDEEMISCKTGNWYEEYPELGRANNSVVLKRKTTDYSDFSNIWSRLQAGGAGEPAILWIDEDDMGVNPCAEVKLRAHGVCNLTEMNVSDVDTQKELNDRAMAGAFIATLQAGYTDFFYLREEWKSTIEEDALIGVGQTGIANEKFLTLDMEIAANCVKAENARVAGLIGINRAKRTTVVKPAGTSSLVLGTSSGIHSWHSEYYKRRIRIGKNEALYSYLQIHLPELIEDEFFKPTEQAVLSIPVKAPEGSITKEESTMDLLERVKRFNKEWIKPGSFDTDHYNNVSATVEIKEGEWDIVKEWVWANKEHYMGISLLPEDGGTYKQMPMEAISAEEYNRMLPLLNSIDLTKVVELVDNTEHQQEAACQGGSCTII